MLAAFQNVAELAALEADAAALAQARSGRLADAAALYRALAGPLPP